MSWNLVDVFFPFGIAILSKLYQNIMSQSSQDLEGVQVNWQIWDKNINIIMNSIIF